MNSSEDYYRHGRPEIASVISKTTKTILDIGCGEGYFLKVIKEQIGSETWGIEMVKEVANRARNNADHVFCGKIEDVLSSIPDRYFDCITFNDVLEHVLDPTELLKMIRVKLSQDGMIVASIPNVRYFFNLYQLLVKKDWEYTEAGILDSTHFRFFSKRSMARMFSSAGYKIHVQVGINEIESRKFRLFNFLTFGILNDTKYLQFLCVAKPVNHIVIANSFPTQC